MNNENRKKCKKCGRKLPLNYEYEKCEACRNHWWIKLKDRIWTAIKGISIVAFCIMVFSYLSGGDNDND